MMTGNLSLEGLLVAMVIYEQDCCVVLQTDAERILLRLLVCPKKLRVRVAVNCIDLRRVEQSVVIVVQLCRDTSN